MRGAARSTWAWAVAVVAALALAGAGQAGIADTLESLGGKPCPNGSEFTCVTIDVPLDHFDPADTRAIPVVFAVLPASGKSKGLLVTASGGPGEAGVSIADSYTSDYGPRIRRTFDLVFYDQRGLGLSGGLTCPGAAATYYLAPPGTAESAQRFSADCVAELASPTLLPYLGTRQAIEDLEDFRRALGSPRTWMYGISYGTQFAQQYVAAHPDALAGLVLDGTVDLTLSGPEFWEDAAAASERVLNETLASCSRRRRCRADTGVSAEEAYDRLAARLASGPAHVDFPLPSGGSAGRELTLGALQFLAAYQLYASDDRMLLQRALAAAGRGDLVPLLRLFYGNAVVDPETLEPTPDPSWSDAIYYGVDCQDYGYYTGTREERASAFLEAAAGVDARLPRLGYTQFLSDLPCAFWPGSSQTTERPQPLRAEGLPTLVLTATGDPITAVGEGTAVYHRLADGYLFTTEGGPHGTFAWGESCPDDAVIAFLVDGKTPAKRETTCPGILADPYVPLGPRRAASFRSVRAAFGSALEQLEYLPEYYYWDFETPASVGCPAGGGSIRFAARGSTARLRLRSCGFTKGFTMTGTGSWNHDDGRVVLDVTVSGRFAGSYRYVRSGGTVSVEKR